MNIYDQITMVYIGDIIHRDLIINFRQTHLNISENEYLINCTEVMIQKQLSNLKDYHFPKNNNIFPNCTIS